MSLRRSPHRAAQRKMAYAAFRPPSGSNSKLIRFRDLTIRKNVETG